MSWQDLVRAIERGEGIPKIFYFLFWALLLLFVITASALGVR